MLRRRKEPNRPPAFIRYGTFMLTGTTQLIPALRSEPMFLQQTLPCFLASMKRGHPNCVPQLGVADRLDGHP